MRRALTLTILLAATAATAMDPPPDPFGTRRYEGERVFAGDEAFDSWRDFTEALEWRYPQPSVRSPFSHSGANPPRRYARLQG